MAHPEGWCEAPDGSWHYYRYEVSLCDEWSLSKGDFVSNTHPSGKGVNVCQACLSKSKLVLKRRGDK